MHLNWPWGPPCVRKRVVINLQNDTQEAIEGVLWAYTFGGWIVVKDAQGLRAGQPPIPILGEIVVHRSNVAYLQALP